MGLRGTTSVPVISRVKFAEKNTSDNRIGVGWRSA
jgi:hypothetical protein